MIILHTIALVAVSVATIVMLNKAFNYIIDFMRFNIDSSLDSKNSFGKVRFNKE